MNHQPYNEWILTDAPLSDQQKDELRHHLRGCSSCRDLQTAHNRLESCLKKSPQAAPPPGFAKRWQSNIALFKARDLARRRRRRTYFITLAAFGSLLAAAIWMVVRTSPISLVARVIETVIEVRNGMAFLQQALTFARTVLPPIGWVGIGLILLTWFLLITFSWGYSLRHVLQKGAVNE